MYDVIVVGGSYAGLAAALQIARARRRVLVLDAGKRRNRFASSSHGFLGQDGVAPEVIAAKGRAEVLAYPTVSWRDGTVTELQGSADNFTAKADGETYRARRLVLALGVSDVLPDVDGLRERWGRTIFHCPYCHGYELGLARLGVLATSALAVHQVTLIAEWAAEGQATLFVNEAFALDEAQRAELATRRIEVEQTPVQRIEGAAPRVVLQLTDGRSRELDGLFALPQTRPTGGLAEQLGCELDAGPIGTFVKTDPMKETTVPGVFACGDAALAMGSVSFAVADGVRGGVAAHQSLVFRPQATTRP